MKAVRPSETSANFHLTTRSHIAKDGTLRSHCRENLKPDVPVSCPFLQFMPYVVPYGGLVKLSLCLIKHHAMKMKKRRYSSTIFDPGTKWRWVVIFTPLPLWPRGSSSGTDWIEAGSAPEPVWTISRREKGCPYRKSNPGRPARNYTDWAIPSFIAYRHKKHTET
jgi:hypothetical protein